MPIFDIEPAQNPTAPGYLYFYHDTKADGFIVDSSGNILSAGSTDVDWVNVTHPPFNAQGDGSTDDTAAIQAAIDSVPSQGGTVYLPKGTYNISAPLVPKSNLRLVGDGRSATRIFQTDVNQDGIKNVATGLSYLTIEELDVRCTAATGTGIGINLGATAAASTYLALRNLNVQGFGGTGIYLGRWIVTTVIEVRSQGHGGHGFHFDRGTSITVTGTYALSCQQAGYRANGSPLTYIAFVGTAADHCGIGYELVNCRAVSLNGCGAESGSNNSVSYPGTGIKLDGCNAVGIYSCFNFDNPEVALYVTGSSTQNTIANFMESTPHAGAVNSIKVDTGSRVTVISPNVTTAQSYATGSVMILNDGTSEQRISAGADGTGTSKVEFTSNGNISTIRGITATASGTNTQGIFSAQGQDASNRALTASLVADSVNRYAMLTDGSMSWGSGSATRDTDLSRAASGVLATTSALDVQGRALGIVTPRTHGLVAWTHDPVVNAANGLLTNGTVYLSRVEVNRAVAVTKLYMQVGVVAVSPTAGQSEIGLYTSAGVLLASVNIDSAITSTGLLTGTIASQNLTPGFYWVGIVANAATAPQMARQSASTSTINVGLATAALRFCTNATTQTSLPTPLTLASNAAGASFWAAVGP